MLSFSVPNQTFPVNFHILPQESQCFSEQFYVWHGKIQYTIENSVPRRKISTIAAQREWSIVFLFFFSTRVLLSVDLSEMCTFNSQSICAFEGVTTRFRLPLNVPTKICLLFVVFINVTVLESVEKNSKCTRFLVVCLSVSLVISHGNRQH